MGKAPGPTTAHRPGKVILSATVPMGFAVREPGAACSSMPYSFRNRISLTHGTRLGCDMPKLKLSADGATENVLLHTPDQKQKIEDATELVLSGGGYSTFAEAEEAGRRWRQHLIVAMAISGIGAYFGPADDVKARRGNNVVGRMIHEDRPGLQVLEFDANAMFMSASAVGHVSKSLDNFLAVVTAEVQEPYVPQSDSHELAYSLVHAAHFESNPETVHVLLVTALEAIISSKHQLRAEPVRQILDEFIAAVKQRFSAADPHRELLLRALGNAKSEGINESGSRVASELLSKSYGGEAPGAFSKGAYGQRNSIVHGRTSEKGRPTRKELDERREPLFRFVLDLLAADRS